MRRILCALTLAAYPIGGVLADAQTSATEIAVHGSHNAKVTLVYEHELPNVPGKSVKGVLVEYGPGGSSVAHTHPASAFIYATVLEGAIVSKVNEGPETVYRAGESWSELPGDRHAVSRNASSTEQARLLAVFVLDTGETNLVLPYQRRGTPVAYVVGDSVGRPAYADELKDARYAQRLDRSSADRGQVMQVTGDNNDAFQAVTAP